MAKSDEQNEVISIRQGTGCVTKGIVALLLLIIAAGIFAFWWTSRLNNRAQEILTSARQAAEALQQERPVIKPEDNAAGPFATARGLHVRPADATLEYDQNDAKRDFKSDAVKDHLKGNTAFLAALDKALALPACDYGVDYSKGLEGHKTPKMGDLSGSARVLVIAARNAAAEGRTGEALGRLAQALRVADPVSAELQLLYRVTRGVIEKQFVTGLTGVLNDSEPTRAELERLLSALKKHADARGDISGCFKAEKVLLALSAARAIAGETSLQGNPALLSDTALRGWWWRYSGNFAADAEMMNDLHDAAISSLSQPYPQALDAIKKSGADPAKVPSWALICQVAVANPATIAENDCEVLARLRMAHALIGLRLHRLAKGSYPEKLEELSGTLGSLPLDPFTGKDFGYRKTAKGCLLWSTGRDRVDDGGKTDKGADLVLELAR